jgi:hypothetical protein
MSRLFCFLCGVEASHSSSVGFVCPKHAVEWKGKGTEVNVLKDSSYAKAKLERKIKQKICDVCGVQSEVEVHGTLLCKVCKADWDKASEAPFQKWVKEASKPKVKPKKKTDEEILDEA